MSRLLLTCLLLLSAPIVYSAGREFELPEAMAAAGEQVPSSIQTYSFFYIQTPDKLKKDTEELATRLGAAAAEKDYLGLAGPNAEWNRSVLREAMAANKGRDLRGLTLIYLGPSSDSGAVKALVGPSGAELRYVVYPKNGS